MARLSIVWDQPGEVDRKSRKYNNGRTFIRLTFLVIIYFSSGSLLIIKKTDDLWKNSHWKILLRRLSHVETTLAVVQVRSAFDVATDYAAEIMILLRNKLKRKVNPAFSSIHCW